MASILVFAYQQSVLHGRMVQVRSPALGNMLSQGSTGDLDQALGITPANRQELNNAPIRPNAQFRRAEVRATQSVLERHGLLEPDPVWADGTTALATPAIQAEIVAASGGALTAQQVDQLLGITPFIRQELNNAPIRTARPQ